MQQISYTYSETGESLLSGVSGTTILLLMEGVVLICKFSSESLLSDSIGSGFTRVSYKGIYNHAVSMSSQNDILVFYMLNRFILN